jgi:methionine synthase II (cobalamin-independent)
MAEQVITKDTTIEELIEIVPASVKYLMEKGIRCIVCGEPIWGTLEEAAKEKGFSDKDIEGFVKDLNYLYEHRDEYKENEPEKKIDVDKLDLNE